jgi:hypothetical protein
MNKYRAYWIPVALLVATGCTPNYAAKDTGTNAEAAPESDSDAEWDELEDGGEEEEKEDDSGEEKEDDTGKVEYQSCGDEVEAGASCEGEWKATLCVDEDGTLWWCEGGVWTSDKDR